MGLLDFAYAAKAFRRLSWNTALAVFGLEKVGEFSAPIQTWKLFHRLEDMASSEHSPPLSERRSMREDKAR